MSDNWTDRLSEYLDEELDEADRVELEAHLAECATCAHVLRQLQDVKETAANLQDRPPEVDLWQGISERVRAIPQAQPDVVDIREGRQRQVRRFHFTLPQLAAAGIALVLISAGGGWLARPNLVQSSAPSPSAAAQPAAAVAVLAGFEIAEYDAAVDELQQILEQGRDQLDPGTVAVLDRSLDTIDRAIAEAREALSGDPANSYLSTHLANTMNRKIRLLQHAATLATAAS